MKGRELHLEQAMHSSADVSDDLLPTMHLQETSLEEASSALSSRYLRGNRVINLDTLKQEDVRAECSRR